MNNKITVSASLLMVVCGLGYLGYTSLQNNSPIEMAHYENQPLSPSTTTNNDLDLDLCSLDPIDDLAETILHEDLSQPPTEELPIKQEVETVASTIEDPIEEALPEPETPQATPAVAVTTEAEKNTSKQTTPDQPKQRSKEEVFKEASKKMETLQLQAAEEWSRMTPEEQAVAEHQVEEFQENFQKEFERLSKLTPEEIEYEKNVAMAKLAEENPEAYEAVKSMEEMFMGLADASE